MTRIAILDYGMGNLRSVGKALEHVGAEPALLGVWYIIGPRIASIMVAGGVLAYLVLTPAISAVVVALLPSRRTDVIKIVGLVAATITGALSIALLVA